MQNTEHLIVTIHGIRTFGEWQDRLSKMLDGVEVSSYGYGYFSVVSFFIPFLRWIAVRIFRLKLKKLIELHPGAEFSFVAHSFGTHILGYALKGFKPEELPHVRHILLAGSVLPSNFDWLLLFKSGKIKRVINDCGTNDSILILSQFFVLLTGMAGRVGFYGFTGNQLVNRYFQGGHSHYFEKGDDGSSPFMERYWLPLLQESKITSAPSRPTPTPFDGILHALLPYTSLIKLLILGTVIGLPIYFGFVIPKVEAARQTELRLLESGSQLLGNNRTVIDGTTALASLALQSNFEANQIVAKNLSRFGFLRLIAIEDALKTIPNQSVFLWQGKSYLHINREVVELPSTEPVASITAQNKIIIFEQGGTGTVLSSTGEVIWKFSFREQPEMDPPSGAWILNNGRYILFQVFQYDGIRPSGNGSFWLIDLTDRNATSLGMGEMDMVFTEECAPSSISNDGQFNPSVADQALGLIFEESVYFEEEPDESAVREVKHGLPCAQPIPLYAVADLEFPKVRLESDLWKSITPPSDSECDALDCENHNVGEIKFNNFDFSTATHDGNSFGEFYPRDDNVLLQSPELKKSSGLSFLIWAEDAGGWGNIKTTVCSTAGIKIQNCTSVLQPGVSRHGPAHLFKSIPYMLSTDGLTEFKIVDLRTMSAGIPIYSSTRVIDSYINSYDSEPWFVIMSAVPGSKNSLRVTAYQNFPNPSPAGTIVLKSDALSGENDYRKNIFFGSNTQSTFVAFTSQHTLSGLRFYDGTLHLTWVHQGIDSISQDLYISSNENVNFFVAYSKNNLRIIDTSTGYFLSEQIAVADIGVDEIESVSLDDNGQIIVKSKTGWRIRESMLTFPSDAAITDTAKKYLGVDFENNEAGPDTSVRSDIR
ncbi:MAG: hypothetical protein B0W54_12700 [Cellvibrio sp. 79]|nr:MAG: hypothetical protein B0W54_12700 [Cellvibrio sp. 79]